MIGTWVVTILRWGAKFTGGAVLLISALFASVWIYVRLDKTGSRRKWFSKGPLGLRKRLITKKHAIIDVSTFKSLDDWTSKLKRSATRNITNLAKRLFDGDVGVQVRISTPEQLGWEHLTIIWQHERRSYGVFRAALASVARCLVASSMCGIVEEYRTRNGQLLAWTQLILKGDTMRAMWFYQTTYSAQNKMGFWFGALRRSMQRAIAEPAIRFLGINLIWHSLTILLSVTSRHHPMHMQISVHQSVCV